jgi:hypothetical protein
LLEYLQQFLDKIKLQEDEYEYRIYHQSVADFWENDRFCSMERQAKISTIYRYQNSMSLSSMLMCQMDKPCIPELEVISILGSLSLSLR